MVNINIFNNSLIRTGFDYRPGHSVICVHICTVQVALMGYTPVKGGG